VTEKVRTYTCAACKGEFESDWTEEEANAEALKNFGVPDASTRSDMDVVCDDCYKIMTSLYPPADFMRDHPGGTQ